MKHRPVFSVAAFALLVGSAIAARPASADPPQLPPPVDVCVAGASGPMVASRAVPSRAGTYDPNAPINPAELNWFSTADGRCVSPPTLSRETAVCGSDTRPRPVVRRVLCQQ